WILELLFCRNFVSLFFCVRAFMAKYGSSMCIREPFVGKSCDTWIVFLSIFMLLFMALYAITNLFSGYNYWRSKPQTINWVAASLNLISIPIGTILGVFSIVVLTSYLKNLQDKNSD
ncbi:hypothetical protein, partial [Fischerella thermalis]